MYNIISTRPPIELELRPTTTTTTTTTNYLFEGSVARNVYIVIIIIILLKYYRGRYARTHQTYNNYHSRTHYCSTTTFPCPNEADLENVLIITLGLGGTLTETPFKLPTHYCRSVYLQCAQTKIKINKRCSEYFFFN